MQEFKNIKMDNLFKSLFVFMLVATSWNANGQLKAGDYFNQAGQKLTIYDVDDCCFKYEVVWGVKDKHSCLFVAKGSATFSNPIAAYDGEDPDWANITFSIDNKTIQLEGGLDFIGSECAKFSDCNEPEYTVFKRN
jgi:hypothetical protein